MSNIIHSTTLRNVAQQARDKANETHIRKAQELSALCLREAEQGKFSYSANGSISNITKKALEESGFKVSEGSQYNDSYYSISW